ncbi:hypothetical protein JCM16814_08460 [Desulfobaculum senezii]
MPKIAHKALTFLLRKNANSSTKVEIYPAELWEGRAGAEPGLFRVRVDRVWDHATGKWTFRDLDGVLSLLRELSITALDGEQPTKEAPPDLPRGSRVRIPSGQDEFGNPLYTRTMTTTPPFLAIDGHWYSFVIGSEFTSANGELRPVRVASMKPCQPVKLPSK